VPTGGDSSHFEFDIIENSTIDWQWVNDYNIDLDYSGCGAGVPTQYGEGWYIQGETAYIGTDSVVDVGGTYFIFDRWEDGPVLPDTFNTSLTVDSTYDITAVYTRGARIVVKKNPLHTEGYIEVDGFRYWDTDELTLWWRIGSMHNISVTDFDSTATTRWTFDRWSDGGAITHDVGPVTSDMTLIAHYNRQFLIRLEKDPLENVYGRLGFGFLPPVGYFAEHWFNDGDSTYISVSDTDYSASGNDRWIFDVWSDGGGIVHQIHATEPETLKAQYQTQRSLFIRKEPPESYGWIIAGDTSCVDCNGLRRWVGQDSSLWTEVSGMDVSDANDSVFYFTSFSDGGAVGHEHGPITAPDLLVAFYNPVEVNLAICLDTNLVTIDSVHLGQVVTGTSQMIRVENCGDIACTWGLFISFPGAGWSAGIGPANDRFCMRGIFNTETLLSPVAFNPIYDYIRSSLNWASDDYFGPDGWNIEVDGERSMWLQFHAPTMSSTFGIKRIVLTIRAKVYLP
ncbi:hypothetical protein J7L01_06575, partial [bacterium]|nr:hypothetical protein [bacterium]